MGGKTSLCLDSVYLPKSIEESKNRENTAFRSSFLTKIATFKALAHLFKGLLENCECISAVEREIPYLFL